MRELFANKNTKAFCPHCNAHLFTFNRDVYTDETTNVDQVIFEDGQEPNYEGEIMRCRKCNMPYGPGLINLEKPNSKGLQ